MKQLKNMEKYQKKALKTAFYPNMGKNKEYPVIALFEESVELFEKLEQKSKKEEILKEIGDILWYSSMIYYEFGALFIFNEENIKMNNSDFIINVGKIASILKKTLRDNNSIFTNEKQEEFFNVMSYIISMLSSLSKELGSNIDSVAMDNIEKINDRIKRGTLSGSGDNR